MSRQAGSTTVYLTPEVAEKMDAMYKLAAPQEILMLLWAEINEETRNIVVNDTYLPFQEVNAGGCEVTKEGLVKFPHDVGIDRYSTVRGIWHSHGGMGSFYSGTDTKFLREIMSKKIPFFVSIVYGANNQRKARVEIMEPFKAYFDADLKVIGDEDHLEKFRAEYTERVEIYRPPPKPKKDTKGTKGAKGKQSQRALSNYPVHIRGGNAWEPNYAQFTIDNPLFDDDGDPVCCGHKMSNLGKGRSGDKDVLYCRWCYNTVYYPSR